MGLLTNIFFLISTALLIPCMLALLWYLARSLMLVGQTLREHFGRRRLSTGLTQFSSALETGSDLPALPPESVLTASLLRLQTVVENPVLTEKLVRETELVWKTDLERLRSLARNGPAFGLMGTLIPLGPALVGLAAGDLQTLANNLIIAFATTVVGLLVAIMGGALSNLKKHWCEADAILLHFAADRLTQLHAARNPLALSGRESSNGQAAHRVADAIAPASTEQHELVVARKNGEEQ